MAHSEIAEAVQAAMEMGEIKAYYQPKYDAITSKLSGAEALCRWIRKDGTCVMPGSFLPQLEESSAICALDWYILEETCKYLKKLKEEGIHRVPISVNFSRWHVFEKEFDLHLSKLADQYGVPHKYIEAEITETAYVNAPAEMIEWINRVRAAGFSVAIDDFGSGLSSLAFITNVKADVLKIDKSLLDKNCEDEKERIVLESIFDISHRLKMTTVAEGVETKEQLGFLRTCDCRMIQGYLFAKPMAEADFLEICKKGQSDEDAADILLTQASASASSLLLEAVFMRYPLVIFANLSRNSFYMMAYESFSTTSCPSAGVFSELIEHGTATMHPEDMQLFHDTFQIDHLLDLYEKGEKFVKVVTRQKGDDGIYRRVETTDYFVQNPSSPDVLVVTFCQTLD